MLESSDCLIIVVIVLPQAKTMSVVLQQYAKLSHTVW